MGPRPRRSGRAEPSRGRAALVDASRALAVQLVSCAAALALSSAAVGRDAFISRYDGRDYVLVWPVEQPTGVLVLLHDAQVQPFAEEARDGLIDAAAALAARENLALIAPSARTGGCAAAADDDATEEAAAGPERACWRIDDGFDRDLGYLDRLTASVAAGRAATFERRVLVGRGRGADFLVQALQAGRFDAATTIGLVAAGAAPPDARPFPARATGPAVYLEVPEDDGALVEGGAFVLRVLLASPGLEVCARATSGGAAYDGARFAAFLDWMAAPCPVAEPEPAADAEEADEKADGEDDDNGRGLFRRRRPRG